jgi:outer membrane protein, multidrug efflux system
MKTTRRWLMAPLLAALVAAGCATAPPPAAQPLPTLPAAFRGAEGAWTQAPPAEAQARGEWWKAFGDPALDALVEAANTRNTQIEIAAARLAQARAALRAADADRLPQIGVAAGAGRGTDITTGVVPHTLLNAGASLSYELDLFGRLAKGSDAAALDARQREALLQSTRLVVQADVARNWFALRALDVERELVRATVAAYQDTLRLTERRFAAGDVAELDVARVKSEAAANEAEALAIDRQRSGVEHALALLTGEPASSFRAPDAAAWTGAPPRVPAGVPSTVLARRPDVAAAQNALLAAQARLGVAQAAWFPDLTLTAGAGFASNELSDLFKWSARSWTVGALLSLPVFDGGRRAALLTSRGAEVDAATASYREQVLVAFKDVEDELAALQLLARQADVQASAVDAAARATTLSATRYRNGLVSQLELLDAQRSELRNRRQALQVRAAQYQATVALIRALGGGWSA